MLLNIKHATENMGDSILRFQPLLAECLYNTMELYRKLHSEKEYIISQKNDLNEYDFYNLVVDSKTNDPVGIIYNEGDSKIRNYYSIILDKDIYNNIYHDLSDIDGNYLSGGKYEGRHP